MALKIIVYKHSHMTEMSINNNSTNKLSHAESVLQELRQAYIDELPHKLGILEQLALRLTHGGDFKKTYDEFFRCTHSVKGSAGTFGLYILSSICHQLEDQLKIVDGESERLTKQLVNYWLQYVDLMTEALVDIQAGSDSFSGIEKKLDELRRSAHPNTSTGILVTSSRYIVEICASIISELPIHLSVLDNGYEALGRIMQENFDFVITDKETTGINGIALIAATKLIVCSDKNIRCVLITSDKTVRTLRDSDPDFVIARNSGLAAKLQTVVSELILEV
ncbi:MAG: hypothetical protein GXP08_12390 [Gammaproteobacteria bacterium]|nr:hypothetical protein [Gammaproteobacteria bacterium]